jgi:prephenate dehydrogenase
MFENVCIIGVGLIGGSFGIALREKKLAKQVVGAVRRTETINAAFQKGAVDNATTELAEAARGADLILLACPVGQMPALCEELAPIIKAGAIVTDVGSTKAEIVEKCAPIFGSKAHFIGGHPMAGSERTGVEYARGDLFENAVWMLTPEESTPKAQTDALEKLLAEIGAKPLVLDAKTHDELVAVTSHLPHITAAALVQLFNSTHDKNETVAQLIAGGWRDSTRVAAGGAEMWRDICLSNATPIIENLDTLVAELQNLRDVLQEKDGEALAAWFEAAAATRRKHGYFPRS